MLLIPRQLLAGHFEFFGRAVDGGDAEPGEALKQDSRLCANTAAHFEQMIAVFQVDEWINFLLEKAGLVK